MSLKGIHRDFLMLLITFALLGMFDGLLGTAVHKLYLIGYIIPTDYQVFHGAFFSLWAFLIILVYLNKNKIITLKNFLEPFRDRKLQIVRYTMGMMIIWHVFTLMYYLDEARMGFLPTNFVLNEWRVDFTAIGTQAIAMNETELNIMYIFFVIFIIITSKSIMKKLGYTWSKS